MLRLIVGLGNLGKEYERTRHNIGERVAREFVQKIDVGSWKQWKGNRYTEIRDHSTSPRLRGVRQSEVRSFCFIPKTFMNVSGEAIGEFVHYFKIDLKETLIIHDELDLALGKIQLKFGGSAGGHRGVQSIIQETGTENFWRLRIGIGRPPTDMDASAYVLAPFRPNEESHKKNVVDQAVDLLLDSLQEPRAITRTVA